MKPERFEMQEPKILKQSASNQQIIRSNSHVIGGFPAHQEPRRPSIVKHVAQAIVDKLGYSYEEVEHQVMYALHTTGSRENASASFVANLYFRLLQEERSKTQPPVSFTKVKSSESLGLASNNNNFFTPSNIQPSLVPSIKSPSNHGTNS